MKQHTNEIVAIIAGTGTLPEQAVHRLRTQHRAFFVISLFPKENAAALIAAAGDERHVVAEKFYKIGGIKKLLSRKQASELFFIGKFDKRMLLKNISYDWEFAKLAARLAYRGDSAIMELLVQDLEAHGIRVLQQSDLLAPLVATVGTLCGTPTPELMNDAEIGLAAAQALSKQDIGQTVTVRDGMILSVEALEGTDECIARGIALGKRDVVVCKTCHANQNKQYDIPTLGPETLRSIPPGAVKAVVWHAGRTLITQQNEFIALAKEKGITLLCLEAPTSEDA